MTRTRSTRAARWLFGSLCAASLALSIVPAAQAAGVGVASPATGRLDVIIRHDGNGTTTDPNGDSLVQVTRLNGVWQTPVNIGGSVHKDSEIGLTSYASGKLALAIRSPQNAIRTRFWDATNGWGAWGDVGQNATGGPAISGWMGGKLALAWRNAAGTIDFRQWTGSWATRATLTLFGYNAIRANTGPSLAPSGTGFQMIWMGYSSQPMIASYLGTGNPNDDANWDDPMFQNTLGTPAASTPSQGADLTWGGYGSARQIRRYQPAVGATAEKYVLMGGPVAGYSGSRPGESTLPNTPGSARSERLTAGSSAQSDLIWRSDDGCLQTQTKTSAAADGTWTAQARIAQPATLTSGRCVWPSRVANPRASDSGPEALPEGTIRYFGRNNGQNGWNSWFGVDSGQITPPANRTWMNAKHWRAGLFNENSSQTSWFDGGMVYYPLYSIDNGDVAGNPNWVLRGDGDQSLYAVDGAPYSQLAGNIFDPAYRKYQINRILRLFEAGNFRGLWLDNVNLEVDRSGLARQQTCTGYSSPGVCSAWSDADTGVGAFWGYAAGKKAYAKSGAFPAGENCTGGTIPAGGAVITDSCWAVGVAAFVAEIKAALPPGKELLVNNPYYRYLRSVDNNTYGNAVGYNYINNLDGTRNRNLPTAPGRSIVDSSTYVNYEYAFWNGPTASGSGGAANFTGIGWDYSLDAVFRWIDGVHGRNKGIVADSNSYDDPWELAGGGNAANLARVREFKLAAYFLVNNGRDSFGDHNMTQPNWPTINGSGGSFLYEMNLGSAAALPSNVPAAGAGSTGRGVVTMASSGNRLWLRKFTRTDGKKVYVLLNERSTTGDGTGGSGTTLSYVIPQTGCSDMTTASSPSYRTLAVSGANTTVTVQPRAAAFVLCN